MKDLYELYSEKNVKKIILFVEAIIILGITMQQSSFLFQKKTRDTLPKPPT